MQSAPYRETIRPPLWVVLILHTIFWASLWLYLSFRGEIADGAPKFLWAWDGESAEENSVTPQRLFTL